MKRLTFLLLVILTTHLTSFSQDNNAPIKEVEVHIDTSVFLFSKHKIEHQGREHLYFEYEDEEQQCDIYIYPNEDYLNFPMRLKESGDYTFVDSMYFINNEYYHFKVQFNNLNQSDFVKITMAFDKDSTTEYQQINLFPLTKTIVKFYPLSTELHIGEEKVYELITNNAENVRLVNDWTSSGNIDYRISEKFGQLRLHVLPNTTGNQELNLKLNTKKPYLDENQQLIYSLPEITKKFYVKTSRLAYLHLSEKEITLDEVTQRDGMEVQIENHPLLYLNKTYRIENQEEAGGTLVAELFTRRTLANDKVLCILRTYNYHRTSNGYLYIKDGDTPRFISNINVTPKTNIHKISLLRDGQNWTSNLTVHPGDHFLVRIEGEGLHKANFYFEDVNLQFKDSLIQSEKVAEFDITVPIGITKKSIALLNHSEPTGKFLNVQEYQIPREFDFANVNYGDRNIKLSGIRGPRIYYNTIKDVEFNFSEYRIDANDKLYGKQYLSFDIKVTDKNNKLLELKTIDNIVVCPDQKSPRYQYYPTKDCNSDDLSLNYYLRTKTYELPEWSRIQVKVSHNKDKYDGEGLTKEFEIIQGRHYKFDIDVSFPAGLLSVSKEEDAVNALGDTVRVGGIGNLYGVSMAMIAQFSFYNPDKIATLRPYKIGAGFLALNVFNFDNNNVDRDVGIVVLASLYPLDKGNKLSFPLYFGGGYFVKYNKWHMLVGPGIRVRL